MVDLLSAALRLIAAEHQLSPLAIASCKELEKLVRGDADNVLEEGWRSSLAGTRLRELLRGELRFSVDDGVPRLDAG